MEKYELIIMTMQTGISLCMKWDTPWPYLGSSSYYNLLLNPYYNLKYTQIFPS